MIEAIKYNLANLTNFEGRESRPTFWWYVLFLIVVQYVISFIATVPMVFGAMGSAFDAVQSGASEQTMQADMFSAMADSMRTVMWVGVVLGVIAALMIVAAFVRRLHDSGRSGYWAIIPMVTQAIAMIASVRMMGQIEEIFTTAISSDPAQLQQMQADLMLQSGGWVGYIGYLVVIVFGVWSSDPGPNKYGDVSH